MFQASGFRNAAIGAKKRAFRRGSVEQAGRKAFVMLIIFPGVQREIAVAQASHSIFVRRPGGLPTYSRVATNRPAPAWE
jgi:hypothetical protein